jgi:hypothetical protein
MRETITFSRHHTGDNYIRVAISAAYTTGLAGGSLAMLEFLGSVVKMHDHKGLPVPVSISSTMASNIVMSSPAMPSIADIRAMTRAVTRSSTVSSA